MHFLTSGKGKSEKFGNFQKSLIEANISFLAPYFFLQFSW